VTFLAPWYLLGAGAIAGATVVLHLLITRLPPGVAWPTARFVPAGPAAVRRFAPRPVHPWVLLARVVAILAIGAAFAQPLPRGGRRDRVRVVVVDRSRAVGDAHAVIDSVRAIGAQAPAVTLAGLVLFADSARTLSGPAASDSLDRLAIGARPGRVSVGLIAGIRAATRWRDRTDSIELVLVSPVRGDEIDAATDSIRATWPGEIRLVRVAARVDSSGGRPEIRWPEDGHAPATTARAVVDTVGGLIAGDLVVIAPFVRRWAIDAGRTGDTSAARVLARWVDGEPAAVERPAPDGRCLRDIAVALPTTGDLGLRPEVRRLVSVLTTAPCGADVGIVRVDGASSAGAAWPAASARAASARALDPTSAPTRSPLVVWLLVSAGIALLVETWLRRHPGAPAT